MCYSRIKKAPDCDFFYAAPTPLCVRAVTPLPPGRPGSSRYQGASCVTLFSRKGWPLGRGLLAGVVSPLWLLYFRPAAACLRAPLMGLLSGRAPVCACLRPPAKLVALRYCRITSRLAKSRPPAAADCRKTQVWRSLAPQPPQTVAKRRLCEVSAGGRGFGLSVVCALVCGALGLCPPAFGLCASPLPPFSSPAHRPASGPSRPLCGLGRFCAPLI